MLLPSSATRQAICLTPLLHRVTTSADCVAGLFMEPAYDPVRREVTYRHPAGQRFTPGIVYELTAYTPLDEAEGGFRAFEGTPLGAVARRAFSVRPDPDPPPPRDDIPVRDHFCAGADPSCASRCAATCSDTCSDDAACLTSCIEACASTCPRSVAELLGASGCGSCHGGEAAAAGLDTRTAPRLAATAIGRVAHGTLTGPAAHAVEASPSRFGRAMPILHGGSPGTSYLLYKILASAETPLQAPLPSRELERVRATLVVGAPMPPSDGPWAALRDGEAEWLSDWILQGAPLLDACP